VELPQGFDRQQHRRFLHQFRIEDVSVFNVETDSEGVGVRKREFEDLHTGFEVELGFVGEVERQQQGVQFVLGSRLGEVLVVDVEFGQRHLLREVVGVQLVAEEQLHFEQFG
jgi:hypothetical protein